MGTTCTVGTNESLSFDTLKLLSECKCCMRKLLHVWNKKLSNQSTIEATQIESLIKGDKNDCNLSTIGSPLNGCRVNVVKTSENTISGRQGLANIFDFLNTDKYLNQRHSNIFSFNLNIIREHYLTR